MVEPWRIELQTFSVNIASVKKLLLKNPTCMYGILAAHGPWAFG
jgi:hypothetical protein